MAPRATQVLGVLKWTTALKAAVATVKESLCPRVIWFPGKKKNFESGLPT